MEQRAAGGTALAAEDRAGVRAGVRDCVVLGCGRSGTSAVAGLLAEAGWHLGDRLLAANEDNPKGYFEDLPVNRLNDALLAPACTAPLPGAARPLQDGERWLAALPADVELPARPDLLAEQERLLAGPGPQCRKDPRFTWTLPHWPGLAGAVRVVPFRAPLAAARSMVGMTAGGTLGLDLAGALAVWAASGRRALHLAAREDAPWVFLPYERVLDGSALPRLASALGVAELPGGFADRALSRQPADGEVPAEVQEVHEALLAASA